MYLGDGRFLEPSKLLLCRLLFDPSILYHLANLLISLRYWHIYFIWRCREVRSSSGGRGNDWTFRDILGGILGFLDGSEIMRSWKIQN
jgi:hypothetical protein